MNKLVKRYVGRRNIVDSSGKVIAYIERNPYGFGYRHISEDSEAPHMFLNLNEVRDYYNISKKGERHDNSGDYENDHQMGLHPGELRQLR